MKAVALRGLTVLAQRPIRFVMQGESFESSAASDRSDAETAADVAERGLAAWRAAKEAWLDAFAAFAAQEAEVSPRPAGPR